MHIFMLVVTSYEGIKASNLILWTTSNESYF